MITFKKKKDNITKSMNQMLENASRMSAPLNGQVYQAYVRAQIRRWETQGASEGAQLSWADNREPYKTMKRSIYAAYPGAGSHVMVGTGVLSNSAIGRDTGGITKIVTDKSLIIRINLSHVPYAAYPAEDRPFMRFGQVTRKEWRVIISTYIKKGRL